MNELALDLEQGDIKLAKLPKYTLSHNRSQERWELIAQGAEKPKAVFERKADATAGGVLEKSLGLAGGSVRIKKEDGKIQEERTYPRSADPKEVAGLT